MLQSSTSSNPTATTPIDRDRIGYLDRWRGTAITLVFVGHFFPVAWLEMGAPGVELFFILSGRLMAEILFVKRPPLKEFYWRRFSRVYPALLVFVLTSALLFSGTWMHVGPLPVLSALTFTLNYAMMFAKRVAMLEHIWSLCVEKHAYILLGALAVAFRKMVQVPLVLLIVGLFCMANGILLTVAQGTEFSENSWTVYARSDVAMAPIFLSAALFSIFRDHKSQNMEWASPACLFAGLICKLDSVPDLLQHSMGTFLLAMSMATLHLSVATLRYALALAPMRILGVWSYSLYPLATTFLQIATASKWLYVTGLDNNLHVGCFTLLWAAELLLGGNSLSNKTQ